MVHDFNRIMIESVCGGVTRKGAWYRLSRFAWQLNLIKKNPGKAAGREAHSGPFPALDGRMGGANGPWSKDGRRMPSTMVSIVAPLRSGEKAADAYYYS